jgi:glucose uptake protein GlcU
VAGSAIASIVFPTLAFGVFMPEIVLGQFVAKFVGGFLWSLVLQNFFRKDEVEVQSA